MDEVLQINEAIIGPGRLRDRPLLESALARPASSAFGELVFQTVHDQAAATLHAIARSHAFLDGNKRTALVACVAFYRRCGYRMTIDQDEFADLVVEVAQGTYSVGALAGSLKGHVEPVPDEGLEPPD
ncbi:type II toxin-antitoxin system death-on-curing family toxin [Euzebya sp.]|uniref:type II toxin-antitoxin system death-on-curing family toxin n=1 Tax=Euzebya sp. TaxID=1971409 RepID=UPI0035142BF7